MTLLLQACSLGVGAEIMPLHQQESRIFCCIAKSYIARFQYCLKAGWFIDLQSNLEQEIEEFHSTCDRSQGSRLISLR